MKKENIVGASLFIILLIMLGLYQTNKEKKLYNEKGILTIGTVLKVEDDYKKIPYVYYRFYIGNIAYNGRTSYPEFKANIQVELINKEFPVIYIKDEPRENHILISRAEFKKFNLAYPDTLLWTTKLEVP